MNLLFITCDCSRHLHLRFYFMHIQVRILQSYTVRTFNFKFLSFPSHLAKRNNWLPKNKINYMNTEFPCHSPDMEIWSDMYWMQPQAWFVHCHLQCRLSPEPVSPLLHVERLCSPLWSSESIFVCTGKKPMFILSLHRSIFLLVTLQPACVSSRLTHFH
jgi:hypothetical protein